MTIGLDFWSEFVRVENLKRKKKKQFDKQVAALRWTGCLDAEEVIDGVFTEYVYTQSLDDWLSTVNSFTAQVDDRIVFLVHSRRLYEEIASFLQSEFCWRSEVDFEGGSCWRLSSQEAEVNAKNKSIARKVKPVATQLFDDSQQQMRLVAGERVLRDVMRFGHRFTLETLRRLRIGGGDFLTEAEKKTFEEMIMRHGKTFAFTHEKIGCMDPNVVAPMVIFTVPHVPWDQNQF